MAHLALVDVAAPDKEADRAQCVKRGGLKLFFFFLVFKFFLAPKWFETAMFQMCHSSDFVLI